MKIRFCKLFKGGVKVAGRKKQPLSVIQGKGRSNHLTKRDIKERQEQEKALKGFTDNIEAPSWLTAPQRKEFDKIASELVRLGIFSNLDVDFLALYIDARDEHIKLAKDIRKMKKVIITENEDGTKDRVANDDYIKLRRTKNTTFNECKAAASELGLSITSRLKLVIPKKEDDEPKSEFEKKFGDV